MLDGNYLRPDIIGKRLDGTFDIFEFASKSQSCGHNFKALMAHVDLYRGLSNVNISVLINW